jgi:electron transport complex protein RnfD
VTPSTPTGPPGPPGSGPPGSDAAGPTPEAPAAPAKAPVVPPKAPKAPKPQAPGGTPRAPGPEGYTLSYSPHLRRPVTIASIMRDVLLALLPATAVGVYLFGLPALKVIALCVAGSVAMEVLCQRLMRVPVTVNDLSAAVTGLLLALTMPPRAEWWLCLVGAAAAIGLGKHVFGGLGYNPFNPALLGRVVLLISFPAQMTAFYGPRDLGVDAVTTATPLGMLHEARIRGLGLGDAAHVDLAAAFWGTIPGSIGETSAAAILVGALFLLWRRHITWDIPTGMLGTMAAVAAVAWWADPGGYAPPHFHLLTGGAMLAAFFMATDMVTSPLTTRGKLIFGVGCGLLTIVIRMWGGYAEAVSFGILLMNATVPLIDRYTAPRLYGTGRPPSRGPAR